MAEPERIDWEALLATSRGGEDVAALKAGLPLEYVLLQAGVVPEGVESGRLVMHCPFHDDERPSFAVWKRADGEERAGCWVCSDKSQGDLFDVIGWFWSTEAQDFPSKVQKAEELLIQLHADEWHPSALGSVGSRAVFNPDAARQWCRDAYARAASDPSAIVEFVGQKDLDVPPDWLRKEFLLGVTEDGRLVIPYFERDELNGLHYVGHKHRAGVGGKAIAVGGVKLERLYGEWREQGSSVAVVCEGESDTWRVSWEYHAEDIDVYGLPSGAKKHPAAELVEKVAVGKEGPRERVYLLFDGDATGRAALRGWYKALGELEEGKRPKQVLIVPMENEHDAASVDDVRRLVNAASEVPPLVSNGLGMNVDRTCYERVSGTPQKPVVTVVSDFVMEPTRYLQATEERLSDAFEVMFSNGQKATLSVVLFESEPRFRAWCNNHGKTWSGNLRDQLGLLSWFRVKAPFLARSWLTDLAGYHEGTFVLPGLSIGPRSMVWVPGKPVENLDLTNWVAFDADVEHQPGDFSNIAEALMRLRETSVIGPVIAWYCAAPLRSSLPYFPPLGVFGGSGYGKTTMLEQVQRVFGWSTRVSMNETTGYAVNGLVASSSGVPLWFDEYRSGMKLEAKDRLDQCLRAGWDASPSYKGGMNETNGQILSELKTLSPVSVSGERSMVETSHIERMVIVEIGKPELENIMALSALHRLETRRFGHTYLVWLQRAAARHELPVLSLDGAVTRPEVVECILHWGWALWETFLEQVVYGPEWEGLPELDLGRVERRVSEHIDPYVEALIWGLENHDHEHRPLVWVDGDLMYVRVRELMRGASIMSIELPGGERDFKNYLQATFGADDRARGVYCAATFGQLSALRVPLAGVVDVSPALADRFKVVSGGNVTASDERAVPGVHEFMRES